MPLSDRSYSQVRAKAYDKWRREQGYNHSQAWGPAAEPMRQSWYAGFDTAWDNRQEIIDSVLDDLKDRTQMERAGALAMLRLLERAVQLQQLRRDAGYSVDLHEVECARVFLREHRNLLPGGAKVP